MRETDVHLGEPPAVVNIGVGVHGVASRTDVFRLPELWQLHLYQYDAELTVDGTAYPIRPGRVSLVPPGTTVRYRYQGRSEHLYAHLRIAPAGPSRTVPVMQDAGPEFPMLSSLLLNAIAAAPGRPSTPRPRSGPRCGASPGSPRPPPRAAARTRRSARPSPTSRPGWRRRSPSRRSPARPGSPTTTSPGSSAPRPAPRSWPTSDVADFSAPTICCAPRRSPSRRSPPP